MGLLTIIRKAKLREQEVRVLILGLDNAGKSTILSYLLGEPLSQVSPTLGFDIKTVPWRNGIRVNVWDVGGQETIRTYWRNYFEETDGLIWVVDSSDRARLEICAAQLGQVLFEERLLGASLLILANKQDLAGALSAEEIAVGLRLDQLGARHWEIRPCSAYTGEGVREGFDWLVGDVSERVFMHSASEAQGT
jgi:ADP-ribosylation factor-like protein 2